MKKLLVIILIITSLFGSTVIGGCKDNKKEVDDNKVVLANFEQWGPDFQILQPESYFGAVNVNTDKKYIKSGKQSAKIQPMGNKANGGQAVLTIPLSSELFNYDYTDFRYVKKISFWFYNIQEETKLVEIGVKSSALSKFADYYFENGWTRVVIYPDFELLSYSIDLSNVEGIYFAFENAKSSFTKDLPIYYIDDVELEFNDEPVSISPIELDENEIIDFEKEYQNYVITLDKMMSREYYYPDFEIVKASDYGLTAPHGENVLRIQTYHAEREGDYQWPRIYLGASYMKTALSKIPTDEWANYEMLYDVYCEQSYGGIYNEFNSFDDVYTKADGALSIVGGIYDKQEWYTVSVSLAFFVGKEVQRNPGKFFFRWYSYPGDVDYTYYIDNFRYQKIAE